MSNFFGKMKSRFYRNFEIRNSNVQNPKQPNARFLRAKGFRLDHWVFGNWNLFRPALARRCLNILYSLQYSTIEVYIHRPCKPGLGQGFRYSNLRFFTTLVFHMFEAKLS